MGDWPRYDDLRGSYAGDTHLRGAYGERSRSIGGGLGHAPSPPPKRRREYEYGAGGAERDGLPGYGGSLNGRDSRAPPPLYDDRGYLPRGGPSAGPGPGGALSGPGGSWRDADAGLMRGRDHLGPVGSSYGVVLLPEDAGLPPPGGPSRGGLSLHAPLDLPHHPLAHTRAVTAVLPPMAPVPADLPPAAQPPLPHDAAPTLYIDNLPEDCSRREASHIFRPFIGFKEVRLVTKQKPGTGAERVVLCFVDFADARCAATALEALQGYRLDESDFDSACLRISFARQGPRGGFGGRREDEARRAGGDRGRGGPEREREYGRGGDPYARRR